MYCAIYIFSFYFFPFFLFISPHVSSAWLVFWVTSKQGSRQYVAAKALSTHTHTHTHTLVARHEVMLTLNSWPRETQQKGEGWRRGEVVDDKNKRTNKYRQKPIQAATPYCLFPHTIVVMATLISQVFQEAELYIPPARGGRVRRSDVDAGNTRGTSVGEVR